MTKRTTLWFWRILWVICILVGLGVFLIYAWLPVDGATGDLESFRPEGFHVQWLLDERVGGLQVGDIIVRAGGRTTDEWLSGAARGPQWSQGEVVTYEVLRSGQPVTLQIQMMPVPMLAIINHWWAQLLVSIGLLITGGLVFVKRPEDAAARLLMLFCTMVAIQMWSDAYNFQYAIISRPLIFGYHFFLEYCTFILVFASILNFVLIFPTPNPLIKRYPRLTIFLVYVSHPLVVALVMMLATTWSQALRTGSHASWVITLILAALAIAAGLYSLTTVRNPVSRAQIRWIMWAAGVALVIMIPGYALPLALSGQPLIPHPVLMLFTGLIIIVLAISILRYRLFDIEIIINRTLVYSTLTALLGGLFLLQVRLLTVFVQNVFNNQNETLVVFISTLSIALAFNPLRGRVQQLIDRAFYRQKIQYQKLLPEMTARLATSIMPDQLNQLLTDELPWRLQIEGASLPVLDPDGDRFEPAQGADQPALLVDDPVVESLRRLAQPLMRLQPPAGVPSRVVDWLEQHRIELTIPLIVGDELVGLYNLGPKQSGDGYNREEVGLLNLLGQQAAVGVQNGRLFQAEQKQRRLAESLAERMTRLFDETRRRAVQQEAINAIIALAVTASDLPELLDGVLDLTLGALELDMGALWVEGYRVARNMPGDSAGDSTQTGETDAGKVSDVRIINDWEQVEDAKRSAWSPHLKPGVGRASIVVPVLAGGRSIGALSLGSFEPREWNPEEVALAEAVGRQLGSAVERLDLLARTQEQARQVQQIIDTVPEGVVLLDENRRIILANPAARQYLVALTGDDPQDQILSSLAHKPVGEFLDSGPDKPWFEVVSEGSPQRIFEIAARPLQSEVQQAGWVLILRDVTIEREIQAQSQMQDRLVTVGQLAAGIAHDFNNIMASILVYADLLALDKSISASGGERLGIIRGQIQQAASLIRQILDFSRRGLMETHTLDLQPYIEDLQKLLARVLPETIRLELDYKPGEYLVEADPTRLQQVFMNLALNARDAMPSGGILSFELDRVRFGADERLHHPDLSPGEWIRICVSDTGVGIPEDIKASVFDPFFTTKEVGQGTGLGLAQVYGIVKQHGGSIDLDSQVGEGTTFMVYLPQQVLKEETQPDPQSVISMVGDRETILVVEDDLATREAIGDLLESLNYRVLMASNGKEALQISEDELHSIALFVCDVVMPEMGGVELYQKLKERIPQVKLVFVSGHPIDYNSHLLLEAGQVRWLQKPFPVEELAAVVMEMLHSAD